MYAFNGPAWSIGVEIVCYLAFVLLALALRPAGRVWLLLVGAVAVYARYHGFSDWSLPLASCSATVGCGFQVLKYGSAFILGAGLFLVIREVDARIPAGDRARRLFRWATLAGMILFLLFGVLKSFFHDSRPLPMADREWLLISVFWLSAAYLSRHDESCPMAIRPLYWIGIGSYSVYLWHTIILFLVDQGLHNQWAYPASIIATFIVAFASYRLIEQPPRRFVAARVRRWRGS
jgi:peptidoglycan/LPS O-acetylase OafA/YrhL